MKNPLITPDLRELIAMGDLAAVAEFCREAHPGRVVELLADLEASEIWQVLQALPVALRAEIFSRFALADQVTLATGQNRREMARLLEEMAPDDRADLVQRLDPTLREEILPLVAQAEREEIRQLVSYEHGTAGAVMSTDYAVLRPEVSVREAIDQIRHQAPEKETIYSIYVVDESHRLIGVVSLKQLILARPWQTVGALMSQDVVTVRVDDDQEDVARTIEQYDLLAIPVVSADGRLVGIVTYDDAMDIIRQEQTEDLEKLMAITGRHEAGGYLRTSAWRHFRNRATWVVGLAAVGLISGMIIHHYEATLEAMLILALYMPMVADTGGNTGSQAATVVVRALALREITPRDALRILFKEFQVAMLLAMILGLLSFGKVLFLSQGSEVPIGYSLSLIGLAIALALSLQVVTATLIGAMLPVAAAKLGLDPAVVASPAITTIVDITGLLLYFTTAKVLLGIGCGTRSGLCRQVIETRRLTTWKRVNIIQLVELSPERRACMTSEDPHIGQHESDLDNVNGPTGR